MLLVSEAIARRNVATLEPDRIETRCRDDGARARVRDKQTGRDCGTGPPGQRFLSALEERRIALCYSVIRISQTATGKPPYSNPPYSTGLGSAWDKCCRAGAGPALVIVVEGVRS
jgi:hypothetical protein